MAARAHVAAILFFTSACIANAKMSYYNMKKANVSNEFEPLKLRSISEICDKRHEICRFNDAPVCTTRLSNGTFEYRMFSNPCYLFLGNMCDYPSNEYHIIQTGSCENMSARKFIERRNVDTNDTSSKVTNESIVDTNPRNDTKDMHGPDTTTMHPLYDIDTAFDVHVCPYSCPDVYSPICLLVNMGSGKYFKYFTFVNHCYGDMYYCKHYTEMGPPPGESYEDIKTSPLGWSFCGAYRYMQFARFSEVLSAMGHYGWLDGRQPYSHIMAPSETRPGYG